MAITTLIETGLTPLMPQLARSPGLHVSDVIRDLCLALGHFEERDAAPTRMELGCIMEYAIVSRLVLADPARWHVPGELTLDGLPGTPDLEDVATRAVRECKLTWSTARHTIVAGEGECAACRAGFCKKGWRYEVQLKAYCHMRTVETGHVWEGELDVAFANGDYRSDDCDRRLWRLAWTREELAANWRMLTQRATVMRENMGLRGAIMEARLKQEGVVTRGE